jgi:hypothetical protein
LSRIGFPNAGAACSGDEAEGFLAPAMGAIQGVLEAITDEVRENSPLKTDN